jgi:hypothetical protein
MRVQEIITELRRNPEQNPRINPVSQLEPLSRDPNVFVSYTKLPKLGINPNPSSINTPAAVYAYPLAEIWPDIRRDLRNVPFAGNGNYMYVFRSQSPVMNIDEFMPKDLRQAMRNLHGRIKGSVKSLPYHEIDGPGYLRPFAGLLQHTRDLTLKKKGLSDIEFTGKNRRRPSAYAFTWNKMLRTATGYNAFMDPGQGIIHGGEPTQAMFLDPTKLEIITRIDL